MNSAHHQTSVAVRGRWAGRSLILDITGALDPNTTIRDADRIGDAVRAAVFDAVEEARTATWSAHAG